MIILLLLSLFGILAQNADPPRMMTFVEDSAEGTLALMDGANPVLIYRFEDQLPPNLGEEYRRSCYIHPLFSADGKALTADFPQDHYHHHGLFWTWPAVKTRGRDTQTWHPDDLRQYFSRWVRRENEGGTAVLIVENVWKLDGRDGEVVARETVALHVHPAADQNRIIDCEIVLTAVGGPLELRGAPDQNKGYGGLSIRCAPEFTGAVMTTDTGVLDRDAVNVPFRWADLSNDSGGIAVFVAPYHPDVPVSWMIRNSYAGFLNPSWPGLTPAVLQPGVPVALSYRLYIHGGNAETGRVMEAYDRFLVDCIKSKEQGRRVIE